MNDPIKPVQRSSSRTVVIVMVVVLIVIAIAGIVLAGRRSAPPALGTAAALPDDASTPQGQAPTTPQPTEVLFAPLSDKLPGKSSEPIARFADGARSAGGTIKVSARYLTGADKARDLELAKARTAAVRHALESNGIKVQQVELQIVEMPAGVMTANDANRVELTVR
ncbi:MAG: hypothetical protein ABIO71_01705 [Caldimonas sp.]